MKYRPTNTLAHYNAAPQVHQHDLSELPTSVLSAATLKYRKSCGQVSPNDEAVTFYTLNHCASIVRRSFTSHEPLPAWAQTIMETYTKVCMDQGERMLHYILSISVREMRHLKSMGSSALWTKVEKQFGQKAVDFLKVINSNGDENSAMNTYMNQPPDLTVGAYTKTLAYAFRHGNWAGSYGGDPWGNVTEAVVSMLTGATSMEMLVDTGYTLAHNTAPIFNKTGVKIYHDQDAGALMTILDVQRSGQLPDLMLSSDTLNVKKTPMAVDAVNLVKQHLPHEFKGHVDWKLVDELRPEKDKVAHPYKYQKHYTATPKSKKSASVTAKPVASKTVMTTLLGKKVKMTGEFQVFPHQTVSIVQRVEETA